jgi:hypothetical protein
VKGVFMGISKRNMDDLFNKLSRGESVNGSFNESEGLRNDVEEKKKLLNVFDEGISIKEMLTLEQIKQRTSNINDLLINTINDSNGQNKQQIKKNIPNSASKLIGSNNHKVKQRNKISPFVNDNHTTIINHKNITNLKTLFRIMTTDIFYMVCVFQNIII